MELGRTQLSSFMFAENESVLKPCINSNNLQRTMLLNPGSPRRWPNLRVIFQSSRRHVNNCSNKEVMRPIDTSNDSRNLGLIYNVFVALENLKSHSIRNVDSSHCDCLLAAFSNSARHLFPRTRT